jgi:hypothetical protein
MDAADSGDQPTVSAGATVVITKDDEKFAEGRKKSCAGRC